MTDEELDLDKIFEKTEKKANRLFKKMNYRLARPECRYTCENCTRMCIEDSLECTLVNVDEIFRFNNVDEMGLCDNYVPMHNKN
jgi:hypothetical protein